MKSRYVESLCQPLNETKGERRRVTDKAERRLEPGSPIAIVRLNDLSQAVNIGRALHSGGITALEFTLTNQEAFDAIRQVRADLGANAVVGAGTVLDRQQAGKAIEAGAEFLVTPTFEPDVIACGREQAVPVVCGAFTPSEILHASQQGAAFVKVFPVRSLGPAYIKDVLAPLPDLRLVPTGGVGLDNCAAFIQAGAFTVAVGSSLVDERLIRDQDWESLSRVAQRFVEACRNA